MRLCHYLLVFLLFAFACNTGEKEVRDEVLAIPMKLEVKRFDRELALATPSDLPELKAEYPYLFPRQYPDSLWIAKMNDPLQEELLGAIDSVYPDFDPQREDLELLFKHIRYYFPEGPEPTVITLPSEVDYRNKVILADSLLLIGLDNYLGSGHRFYEGIDQYIAKGLDGRYLLADVAEAFAKQIVAAPRERTFLSRMIYHGKLLYLQEQLLPLEERPDLIGYNKEEWEWARANEEQIWRYFVERELLYSTDPELAPRFLNPAPFSKFRLELDNESPGRLGRYVGWQIVRAYMDNENEKLDRMLAMPAAELFRKSGYKPEK